MTEFDRITNARLKGDSAVESGASVDFESGSSLKLAGTAISATAAELNILDGVTSTAAELNQLDGVALATEIKRSDDRVLSYANIADGTSAGNLKTSATADYSIDGAVYQKAATDDLWDLSGETDTTGAQWRAYWLYLDSSGTATFAAGSNSEVSAADAIANLPARAASKCPIGVFVAGNSCDFDHAGGLDAQGDIYNGVPTTAI